MSVSPCCAVVSSQPVAELKVGSHSSVKGVWGLSAYQGPGSPRDGVSCKLAIRNAGKPFIAFAAAGVRCSGVQAFPGCGWGLWRLRKFDVLSSTPLPLV